MSSCLYGLLVLVFLLLNQPIQAQGLSDEARGVLRQGQQRAAQAMVTYPDHFPDQPLWREAIAFGQRAQRLAPEQPEPYRFLGQVYSVTGWYSRAWESWQSYLEYGGEMDAQARSQLLGAATWLGFHSYSSGDYRRAIPYLQEALNLNPDDRLTLDRLTQAHLALGDPEAARPYAEQLAALDGSDDSLLERVEAYLAYGVQAVDALRQGESLYAEDRPAEALRWFAQAVELSPSYPQALEWAGRVALEVDRPQEAVGYLQRLVQLEPDNDEAQASLSLARNRAEYGEQAYAAYSQGLLAYERGDIPQAEELLLDALEQNSAMADAHALLGRIQFGRGNFEQALERFQRAAQLAPEESSYLFYISTTDEQLRQQREAQALAEERERAEAEERARAAEAARMLEQAQQEAEAQARAAAAARAEAAAEEAAAAQAAAEQAADEQAAAEQEAADQAAAEQAAADQAAAEQAASEQAAAEQAAAEQAAADQAAAEQAAAEQAAAEQRAAEQAAAEQEAAIPQAEQPAPGQSVGVQAAQPPQAAEGQVAGAALPAETSPPSPSSEIPALVIADEVITHMSAEEGGSGAFSFLPGENLSRNLASPVDFASGTLFQRLEVRSKPSDVPVHYQLCLVPNDSISVQPACTSSNLLVFDEAGVFQAEQPLASLSGFQGINWGNGLESVILVIKDPSGVPVDNRYLLGDGSQQPPNPELYYPMEVRFTAVVVPDGEPFPGWPQ